MPWQLLLRVPTASMAGSTSYLAIGCWVCLLEPAMAAEQHIVRHEPFETTAAAQRHLMLSIMCWHTSA
jgi:hypothetical protein